jgi:hypothetical protein
MPQVLLVLQFLGTRLVAYHRGEVSVIPALGVILFEILVHIREKSVFAGCMLRKQSYCLVWSATIDKEYRGVGHNIRTVV